MGKGWAPAPRPLCKVITAVRPAPGLACWLDLASVGPSGPSSGSGLGPPDSDPDPDLEPDPDFDADLRPARLGQASAPTSTPTPTPTSTASLTSTPTPTPIADADPDLESTSAPAPTPTPTRLRPRPSTPTPMLTPAPTPTSIPNHHSDPHPHPPHPSTSAPAASPILGAKPSPRAGIFKKRHQNSVLPSGGIRCSLIRLQRVFSIRAGVTKTLRLLRISHVPTNRRWLDQTFAPICSDLAFLIVAPWPHLVQHQPSCSCFAVNRPLLHTLVHWRPLSGACPTRAAHSSRPPRNLRSHCCAAIAMPALPTFGRHV